MRPQPRTHRRGRGGRAVAGAGQEAQAPVDGGEACRTRQRIAARGLDAEIGALARPECDVDAFEIEVAPVVVVDDPAGAHRHMVAEPRLAPGAPGHLAGIEGIGHVFVVDEQVDIVPFQGPGSNDRRAALDNDPGQRPIENDAALQGIDFVVAARDVVLALEYLCGVALANFHPDLLRAQHDVPVLEVVKGSAGGPEADVGGGGAGLGDERRQGAPRIAEAGLGNAPVSDLAAVERAVVLRELRVRQPGVEIAEQHLVPCPSRRAGRTGPGCRHR